jgi:hypothetical protein
MPPPCRRQRRACLLELVELVTDYLENARPAPDRRLRAHLEECQCCIEYVEQMRLSATASARGPARRSRRRRDACWAAFRGWRASADAPLAHVLVTLTPPAGTVLAATHRGCGDAPGRAPTAQTAIRAVESFMPGCVESGSGSA